MHTVSTHRSLPVDAFLPHRQQSSNFTLAVLLIIAILPMSTLSALSHPQPEVSAPRPEFDSETLKAYIKKLLASTLENEAFPQPKDRDRTKAWCKEIGERVKEQMLGWCLCTPS